MMIKNYLGIGINSNRHFYTKLLDNNLPISWVEIIAENFMNRGGFDRCGIQPGKALVKQPIRAILGQVSASIPTSKAINEWCTDERKDDLQENY